MYFSVLIPVCQFLDPPILLRGGVLRPLRPPGFTPAKEYLTTGIKQHHYVHTDLAAEVANFPVIDTEELSTYVRKYYA